MKCPIDNEPLVMTDRSGVEIDYCPKCRGVWLDRGELDKIIERSAAPAPERPENRSERYDSDDDYRGDGRGRPQRRRESFLSDIFDF